MNPQTETFMVTKGPILEPVPNLCVSAGREGRPQNTPLFIVTYYVFITICSQIACNSLTIRYPAAIRRPQMSSPCLHPVIKCHQKSTPMSSNVYTMYTGCLHSVTRLPAARARADIGLVRGLRPSTAPT